MSTSAPSAPALPATGPRTPEGRAIAARNATTHGLFARDVVLPALGEDPAAFDALLQQLCTQLPPRNLLERHYLEQIAAASWRLRRLHRWQAQIYEDPAITEDERMRKLDSVLRHESALTRQIDRAVRTLNRDLSWLFASRARQEALYQRDLTEAETREDSELGIQVQRIAWRQLRAASPDAQGLDYARLDNTQPAHNEICQNEPPAADAPPAPADTPNPPASGGPQRSGEVGSPLTPPEFGAGRPNATPQICQNELPRTSDPCSAPVADHPRPLVSEGQEMRDVPPLTPGPCGRYNAHSEQQSAGGAEQWRDSGNGSTNYSPRGCRTAGWMWAESRLG